MRPDTVEAKIEWLANYLDGVTIGVDAPQSIADDLAAQRWRDIYFRYPARLRALAKLTHLNYDFDYRRVLSSIQTPTLVLLREGDRWCSIEHAKYLIEHIPNAKLWVLPREDHNVWYGAQGQMISEIQTFVAGNTIFAPNDWTLLTLMFIDLLGSTNLLARMGDDR